MLDKTIAVPSRRRSHRRTRLDSVQLPRTDDLTDWVYEQKLNKQICHAIHLRRTEGATIGQLAKEFELGEAKIYRALKAVSSISVT